MLECATYPLKIYHTHLCPQNLSWVSELENTNSRTHKDTKKTGRERNLQKQRKSRDRKVLELKEEEGGTHEDTLSLVCESTSRSSLIFWEPPALLKLSPQTHEITERTRRDPRKNKFSWVSVFPCLARNFSTFKDYGPTKEKTLWVCITP